MAAQHVNNRASELNKGLKLVTLREKSQTQSKGMQAECFTKSSDLLCWSLLPIRDAVTLTKDFLPGSPMLTLSQVCGDLSHCPLRARILQEHGHGIHALIILFGPLIDKCACQGRVAWGLQGWHV